MANKIKFDRADALEKATLLFWQKGYQGTSMRDLQACLDMRPGSIYASFGSKDNLFAEVLQGYAAQSLAELARFSSLHASPLVGLKQFLSHVVLDGDTPAACRLCLLAKALSELPEEQVTLIHTAQDALLSIEKRFACILRKAQEAGEIPGAANCDYLAKWFQMQAMGLRAFARTGASAKVLSVMIEDVFSHLETNPS